MDYLTLVRNALTDAGAADEGAFLPTLSPAPGDPGLTDYQQRARRLVNEAWRLLQTARVWPWMREELAFVLEAGAEAKTEYTREEVRALAGLASGVWRWWTAGGWFLSETATAQGQRLEDALLPEVDYEAFRALYGGRTLARSRPVAFCITPKRHVRIVPAPGEGRVIGVRGEYVRAPQVLVGDADEPMGLDPAYHDAVKWRAVMLLLAHDEASAAYQLAQATFTEMYTNLSVSEGTGDYGDPGTLA